MIVMPTYKELMNLKKLLPQIKKTFLKNHIPGGILVVDDNSPDGTAAYLQKLRPSFSGKSFFLELLLRPGKLGLGTAYIDGYNKTLEKNPAYVLGMDADFSHDPKYIPEIYRQLHKYDMVIGSRYVAGGGIENWNMWRKLVSKTASIYSKLILGWTIDDPTTAFVGFKTSRLKKLPFAKIKTTGYAFLVELKYLAFRNGFRIKEIPIIFLDRAIGKSKLNKRIIIESIFNSLLIRFKKYE